MQTATRQNQRLISTGNQIAKLIAERLPGYTVRENGDKEWGIYKRFTRRGGFCYEQGWIYIDVAMPPERFAKHPIPREERRAIAQVVWGAIAEVTR